VSLRTRSRVQYCVATTPRPWGWMHGPSNGSSPVEAIRCYEADRSVIPLFMKTLSGLLWALGGVVAGLVAGGLIGMAIAKITDMPSREGASAYFVVFVALVGAALGLIAGVVLFGRSAPDGQGAAFAGSSVLGVVALVAVLALGLWAFTTLRETSAMYDGAMATLELELRARVDDLPVTTSNDWLQLEVQTAKSRPEGDVSWSRARTEGDMRIIPVSQGPLVRSGNRVIVVRVKDQHDEIFIPPMKRMPDRKADWSPWYKPGSVEPPYGVVPPAPLRAIFELRYRIKVYGE
jgi:hypothetical protein